MKSSQLSINYFLLMIVSLVLFQCQGSITPLSEDYEFIVKETIISNNEVPGNWDNTFFQQNTNWPGGSRISAADSLAHILKKTNLPLSDMWFPNVGSECSIVLLNGSDVILKLTIPDTSIYRYGFRKNDGFPIVCIPEWKHYEFMKVKK
jgi:hypothetical protein